jgi:hypothetical protein
MIYIKYKEDDSMGVDIISIFDPQEENENKKNEAETETDK